MPDYVSLKALRALDAFARTGSVASAAGELNVTSSAVSHHIAALNDVFGIAVVEPDGRRLRLTAAGQMLTQRLKRPFDEIDKAVSLIRSPVAVRGTVSLSVAMMFAKEWLVPRLHGFGGGEVDFVFNDDPGASASPASETDLVITWCQRPGGGEYTAEKFGEEKVFPVCAPALGKRIEERGSLAGVPLLHYADIPPGWDWPTWPEFLERTGLDDSGTGRDIRLGRGLVMDAVRAGQGLALSNTTLSRDALTAGRLVRPGTESVAIGSGYWLMTPLSRPVRPEVAAFRDWLRSEYSTCFGVRAGFVRYTQADAGRPRA